MDDATTPPADDELSVSTAGVVAFLLLASAGALAASSGAQTSADDELTVTVDRWCPPQLDGCRQPNDPCARYAEPGRWMGVDLTVRDDGEPAAFTEVTLTYTNASGPQQKTEATDGQGEVSFALRDAEDVSVQAHRPSDGARGSTSLAPTWGQVHITQDQPVPQGTVGEPIAVNVSYTVEGHGPGGTPPGTVTLDDPTAEHRSATLDAENGRLQGTVTGRVAATADYRASGGDVCALPVAEDGFTIHRSPGPPAELSVDCDPQATGNTAFNCTARGEDRFGNTIGPDDLDATWTADPARADDNTGFLDDEGPNASYLPHAHGGWVTLTATAGEAAANETVHVGPEIVSITAEPVADEPIAFELFDRDGLQEARLVYQGQVLDEVTDADGDTVTLTAEFRSGGERSLRVEAVDELGNELPNVPVPLSVGDAHIAPGTGSSSSPSSPSSSGSSTGSSSGATSGDSTDPAPSTVQAEPVGEGQLAAEVDVVDGRTPLVEAPDDTLSVQLESTTHRELVVELRPDADIPSAPPGQTVRTVDVSARTLDGNEAVIDEADLTVSVARDELGERDLSTEDLELFHWTDGRWRDLDAAVDAGEETVQLTATTTSLSPFAVTAPHGPDGEALELTREDEGEELPFTYRGQVETALAGETVPVRTSDGALSFTVDLGTPGEHTIVAEIDDAPSEELPAPVTTAGRYVDVTIVGPDGTERELADARNVSYTLTADELPGEGANLVPVTVTQDTWRPLDGSLSREAGNVTVATQASQPLRGVLADDQAPRVGLQDPLDAKLVGDVEATVVASDNLAVEQVRVLANGAVLAEADERPFTVSFDTSDLDEGTAELRFEAVDRAGNVGETTRSVQIQPEETLGESGLDDAESSPDSEEASAASRETPAAGLPTLALAAGLGLAALARARRP